MISKKHYLYASSPNYLRIQLAQCLLLTRLAPLGTVPSFTVRWLNRDDWPATRREMFSDIFFFSQKAECLLVLSLSSNPQRPVLKSEKTGLGSACLKQKTNTCVSDPAAYPRQRMV